MKREDSSHDARDCGGDVAAYALGALDPHEVATFEVHLDRCAVCRDELAAFQQVVDVLPMSAPAHRAPKRLRRRTMAAVAAEPKLSPSPRRQRSWRPQLAGLRSRPGLAMAGVAILIALSGALTLGGGPTPTRVINARVTGVAGSAQIRVTGGHAELVVHNFSAPPSGQIYEVWLRRRGQPPARTSALFSVTSGNVDVPGSLRGVNLIMVTPEPAGGSSVPTHPAVIRAVLT